MSEPGRIEETFAQLEHLMIADPVDAIDRARAEIPSFDLHTEMPDRIRIRRLLVMALSHANRFEEALEVCKQAEILDEESEASEEVARLKLASMQPLAHLGRIDEAISAGEQASAELEALGRPDLAGRASLNIGAIHAMTGRHQESLESFDRALKLLRDDTILAGQIQTNRGTALAALDRFEEAENAFSRAGEMLGTELPWASAVVEENLGGLAARQGAVNQALRHYEASRRHLEQDNAFADIGRIDAEEALVLSMTGMTALAVERFEQACDILTQHGTPTDLAAAQLGLGRALAATGDVTRAREILDSLSESIDKDESPGLYRQYLQVAAHITIQEQDWVTAGNIIASAREAFRDRPVYLSAWAILEAEVAQSDDQTDEAIQLLESALEQANAANVSPLVASIHEHLFTIARERGEHDKADYHARLAIEGYESIRGTIHADQMRKAWHHGRIDVYGEFATSLMQRPDQESQAEAFDIVERIRSRSLLDAIQQGTFTPDPESPANPDEEPLLKELSRHRRWLNWTYSSLAMGEELTEQQQVELAEREREAQRLADRLATLRPGFGFHQPIDLATVQSGMSDDAVLLSYSAAGESMTLQVVTRNHVHGVADLVDTSTLSELVSHMQFQVGRALVSGVSKVSPRRTARLKRDMDLVLDQLYSVLVHPSESMIAGKRHCLVIPSGDLHSVPFAALRINGEYLINQMTFTTAPSASVLADMDWEGADGISSAKSLVVGVSDETAPGLGEEASILASELPGAMLLLNEEATRERVLDDIQDADLVHMACHGRFDSRFPEASGLRVFNEWLTLANFREMTLNQTLMVLSGCETGRARVDRGDDLVGIMTAMIASGAGALVTSLWKTHDEAAMALILEFYTALRRGLSVPEALRSSQISAQKEFAHPAMWAPFVGVSKKSRGWLA